jgi:hypothetical protein
LAWGLGECRLERILRLLYIIKLEVAIKEEALTVEIESWKRAIQSSESRFKFRRDDGQSDLYDVGGANEEESGAWVAVAMRLADT